MPESVESIQKELEAFRNNSKKATSYYETPGETDDGKATDYANYLRS